ncbi:MAG: rRNA maturation RNase YbeY [Candidatus Marinimicrobia bacterium]|nr:rRNA maturation RNase YbeY [Candidatus Neomarinimicrobiota bacterium]
MQIEIFDPLPEINLALIRGGVEQVFLGEHKTSEYINIIFLARNELRIMKKEYFGLDLYTDVIAFNLNDPDHPIAGEVYLSYEQIIQNSQEFKTQLEDELIRVLIHGCLHLCGYEDDTKELKALMTNRENHYLKIFKELGF